MTEHQLSFELDAAQPSGTPGPPPDDAARQSIRDDVAMTMFVEAGAGTGKTTALVDRILTLVVQGTELESIAAITFSEKAAAELRHRLRQRLVAGDHRAALEVLDRAPIGTLHAFARRLLFEFPVEAGLPPGFVVLDELESRLALDERWEDLLDELFDDADAEVAPGLTAADLMQLCAWNRLGGTPGLRRISEEFQANWDLVEARVQLTAPARPPLPDDAWIDALRAVAATETPSDDRQTEVLATLRELADGLERDPRLGAALSALDSIKGQVRSPHRCGNRQKWALHGGPDALEALRDEERSLLADVEGQLQAWRLYQQDVVGAIVGRFVLEGAQARAVAGTLEFHDLLVLARRLLATRPDVRETLHERFRCLLLDEFQDTDPIQLEIATRLTAPPADQDAGPPVPGSGRLFVVGDPKQSIYRFRRADIATYLAASSDLAERHETLTANFRSSRAVIDWVNGVFGEVIQPAEGVQPAYTRLEVSRQGPVDHGRVVVLGAEPHQDDDLRAKELRQREADAVAAAVATALREGWPVGDGEHGLRPCRAGDVAILLPARTSLPMLETALSAAGIAYRAENSTVVYLAPEIRELLSVLRAAADPTDELALITGLRSPLYGCSDVELYEWRRAGGRWNPFADPPPGLAEHPVAVALADVRLVARAVGHAAPAELLEGLVERRRVLETALGGPDARDVWRRLRYVIDQARAWTDAGGRGLRRYLRWANYQAADARAGDTILPEHDHDAVRVMTIHAAKGLEFPITVVSGLTTRVQSRTSMSVVWPGDAWALAQKDHPLFDEFRPLDEQMSDAERRRLLYVACTRAVDHLVVSLHRQPERVDEGTGKATSATVLAAAGATGHGAVVADPGRVEPLPPAVAQPLELPWADRERWEAERANALTAAAMRSVTSATRLARELPAGPAVARTAGPDVDAPPVDGGRLDDPGLRKDAVDLDLPPWQRGRYGTAIGRAVHAVLQDVDLRDGHDVDVLSAAQCAAEGIFGYEDQVAALCRSALGAPIVRAAGEGAEHWRELFVVAELGATVLEGYVDLLVRTPGGLVIVDYKTDRWVDAAARAERGARYRHQLAAYGVALGRLLDEPIAGGVLVWCRPAGPADQQTVAEWEQARHDVEAALLVTT
jgi:ATP-dependent helicase/nuclease subunit A